jgi:hypothetical protein
VQLGCFRVVFQNLKCELERGRESKTAEPSATAARANAGEDAAV